MGFVGESYISNLLIGAYFENCKDIEGWAILDFVYLLQQLGILPKLEEMSKK